MPIRIVGPLCTALLICNSAGARPLMPWTYDQLNSRADVVIIASVVSTETFDELLEFDRQHPKKRERDAALSIFDKLSFPENIEMDGQLTTFEVATVMKGRVTGDEVQLVHYKLGEHSDWRITSPPCVAVFRKERYPLQKSGKDGVPNEQLATGETQHYILFLKKRKDGRFEPVSGQIDSAFSAIELQSQLPPVDE